MHSQMFNNMLDGVQEADAQTRIENKTNHFAWMVGNLVNCRYWLACVLGILEKDPNEDLFKDGNGLGLFMVKTHVEIFRGTIRVKSELNVGTEFIIELPV